MNPSGGDARSGGHSRIGLVTLWAAQHGAYRKDTSPVARGLTYERYSVRSGPRSSAGLSAVGTRWNGNVRKVIRKLGIAATAARYQTRVTSRLLI